MAKAKTKKLTAAQETVLQEFAHAVYGYFDYAYGEIPTIDISDRMLSLAPVNREDYDAACRKVDAYKVEGPGYTVCMLRDASGYEYWNGHGDSNYIIVYAVIDSFSKLNFERLAEDLAEGHAVAKTYEIHPVAEDDI